MLPPIAFFERGKLILQLARRDAFQVLHHLRWTERRWTGNHQVDVVNTHMPFHNCDFTTHTDLTQNVARSLSDFSAQDVVAIFGHPDQVILNVVDRMRPFAIFRHGLYSIILARIVSLFRAEAIRLKAEVLDQAHGK